MGDWIQPFEQDHCIKMIEQVSTLLSELGGPLTKDLSQLITARRYVDLVNYQFAYTDEASLRDLVCARQVHALLSKQEWMDLGLEPRKKAEEKFWQMEDRCRATNVTMDAFRLTTGAIKVIHLARQKIERILGDVPSLDDLRFSFGPGATTSVKGSIANARSKLSARLACSQDMLPVVGRFLAQAPLWAWHHSGIPLGALPENPDREVLNFPVDVEVHAGKLDFVPKDARTMRPIVVEPILNGFAQKGVGDYMKRRLLHVSNVNLRDQSRNQRLACEGSVGGHLATMDLSSASDTVSWSLVRLLLPWDWFEFLAELRTGDLATGRGVVSLEKFSSMGNGFTFELESLLFYSVVKACAELMDVRGDVSTYGDDIICPSEVYPFAAEVLTELGFLVNTEKSFAAGPFRESCGADWFKGNSIRPFYAKKAWSEQTLYSFHNFAVRNGEPELARLLLSFTDRESRLFGPDGYGDGHLIGSYELRTNRKLRRNGWNGGFFDTYSLNPKRLKKRMDGDWLYPGYSVYTRSSERDYADPDIVRGSDGYAKVSVYTRASSVWGRIASPEAALFCREAQIWDT